MESILNGKYNLSEIDSSLMYLLDELMYTKLETYGLSNGVQKSDIQSSIINIFNYTNNKIEKLK